MKYALARKVLHSISRRLRRPGKYIKGCDPYWELMAERARQKKSRMSGARPPPEKVKWVTRAEADCFCCFFCCSARSASVSWSVLKDPDCSHLIMICFVTRRTQGNGKLRALDGITRRTRIPLVNIIPYHALRFQIVHFLVHNWVSELSSRMCDFLLIISLGKQTLICMET